MSMLAGLIFLAAAVQAEPPLSRTPPDLCTCPQEAPAADSIIVFTGVAFDAVVTLDESGLNPAPRQATIFRVLKVEQGDKTKEAKVWHNADLKKCGVSFDYGKVYRIRATKKDDAFETDRCLMKDVAQPAAE